MSVKKTRPKIEILRECHGDISAQDLFVSLLVDRMKERLSSVDTFDGVNEPEYTNGVPEQDSIKEDAI